MHPFRIQAPAELDNIRLLRNKTSIWLEAKGFIVKDKDNILLCLSEITTNIVKHSEPTATTIFVDIYNSDQGIVLDISDDGSHFENFYNIIENQRSASLDGLFQESGMGLNLVVSLFPNVQYLTSIIRGAKHNVVRLLVKENIISDKPRIAIIDDDISMLSVMEVYLKDDYDVTLFEDPEEAIVKISNSDFDLVISDIVMPNIDGLSLRKKLSATPNTSTLPFIFLSANDDFDTQNLAVDSGIDDYLVKPARRNQLLLTIRRVLNRSKKLKQELGQRLDQEITNSLRPELPSSISNFRIAVRSRSASAGGGDFIFYQPNINKNGFILGDIMGHGEQAKFFAHAHAGFFQGLLANVLPNSSPAQWLKALSVAADENTLLNKTLATCIGIQLQEDGQILVQVPVTPLL